MEMDTERFYDSLDEEEFSARASTPNISETVPFYGKEAAKSEVPSSKSKTRTTTSSSSLSQIFLESSKKKSYVDLFHAKIGYVQGSEATDTTRAVCDTENFETARTSTSLVCSDASFVSDSSSFYMKFIETEQALTDQLISISSRTESTLKLPSCKGSKSSKVTTNRRKNESRVILKVPELGGLGPDHEACKDKLERLKRQQRYGQKVSNANRLRIRENKVIKNFKYELKKSNDLNKCAESVLGS